MTDKKKTTTKRSAPRKPKTKPVVTEAKSDGDLDGPLTMAQAFPTLFPEPSPPTPDEVAAHRRDRAVQFALNWHHTQGGGDVAALVDACEKINAFLAGEDRGNVTKLAPVKKGKK